MHLITFFDDGNINLLFMIMTLTLLDINDKIFDKIPISKSS